MVTIEDLLQKPVSELTYEEFQKITAHKREQERKEKEEKRHAYEQLREETINELGPIAEKISKEIQEFKEKSFTQFCRIIPIATEMEKEILRLKTSITKFYSKSKAKAPLMSVLTKLKNTSLILLIQNLKTTKTPEI